MVADAEHAQVAIDEAEAAATRSQLQQQQQQQRGRSASIGFGDDDLPESTGVAARTSGVKERAWLHGRRNYDENGIEQERQ